MLATAFAPTLLNPVGHGVAELHRLLIDLQVQALTTMDGGNSDIAGAIYRSPYPAHYDGRLATRFWLPASLYLLRPCSRLLSADSAMDGMKELYQMPGLKKRYHAYEAYGYPDSPLKYHPHHHSRA